MEFEIESLGENYFEFVGFFFRVKDFIDNFGI